MLKGKGTFLNYVERYYTELPQLLAYFPWLFVRSVKKKKLLGIERAHAWEHLVSLGGSLGLPGLRVLLMSMVRTSYSSQGY